MTSRDEVYIVLIETVQKELHIGAVYYSKFQAEQEVRRLYQSQGKLEVLDAYWIKRQVGVPREG